MKERAAGRWPSDSRHNHRYSHQSRRDLFFFGSATHTEFSSVGYETLRWPSTARPCSMLSSARTIRFLKSRLSSVTVRRQEELHRFCRQRKDGGLSDQANTSKTSAFSLLDGVVTGVNFRKSGEAGASPSLLVRGRNRSQRHPPRRSSCSTASSSQEV